MRRQGGEAARGEAPAPDSSTLGGASPRLLFALGCVLLGAAAILLRLEQRHHGLLYPDGYQYLLMARGITEHLRPTTILGPGGDLFRPSLDAATKPWFAATVAAFVEAGAPLRSAGGVVAAVSAGLASVAAALLALRLTRSAIAALACGATLLASPALGYWWGFAGPDGMAAALALMAAWLALRGNGVAAGIVTALAVATRPELVVVAVACGLAALATGSRRSAPRGDSTGTRPTARGAASTATRPTPLGAASTATRPPTLRTAPTGTRLTAIRAAASAAATLAIVYAVLRPPLGWSWQFVLAPAAGVVGAGVLLLACRAGATRRGALAGFAVAAIALAALAAAGRASAIAGLASAEWPLLAAAAISCATLWLAHRTRPLLVILAVAGLLTAVYACKNPSSERYVANVLPLVAIVVALGLAAATEARRRLLLGAIVALVALDALLAHSPPAPGRDPFDDIAPQLARLPPGPLVSATPDAYGVLLPDRASRRLRPGARGFVVLDAGQRYYAPGFTARGAIAFRAVPFYGFVRPDGTVDRAASTVIDGVAVEVPSRRRR